MEKYEDGLLQSGVRIRPVQHTEPLLSAAYYAPPRMGESLTSPGTPCSPDPHMPRTLQSVEAKNNWDEKHGSKRGKNLLGRKSKFYFLR